MNSDFRYLFLFILINGIFGKLALTAPLLKSTLYFSRVTGNGKSQKVYTCVCAYIGDNCYFRYFISYYCYVIVIYIYKRVTNE